MKKIWPWLLALVLLILFCVWSKKDSIHYSHSQVSPVKATPLVVRDRQQIEYSITQNNKEYLLNGNFTNTEQQSVLIDTMSTEGSTLNIQNTSINATLLGNDAVNLTRSILPHFVKNYHHGKIVYRDNKLKIYGKVTSYEAQHEMQRLLNASTLLSQDNSTVEKKDIPDLPIEFIIQKENESVHFSGLVNDENQIHSLASKLPSSTVSQIKYASHHVDKGGIEETERILSFFLEKYKNGNITYKNEILTVSGVVSNAQDLKALNALLSQSNIQTINHTTIDQEMLAKEKALLAAEEKEKTQLSKEQALKKETEREKSAAKAKISQLLKVENIEFKVAKGTLTPKGQATVDKLATILKRYPHIHIEIAGHTDSDGSATFNQKLSQSRVDAVKARLISKGIEAKQLVAQGYGEAKPLVPNTNDTNKQKNRRVEFNLQGE